jgi:hypothetical protein
MKQKEEIDVELNVEVNKWEILNTEEAGGLKGYKSSITVV